jgi:hypothetical protein
MRPLPLLLLCAAILGCRPDVQQTGQGQPGNAADSALTRQGDTVESAGAGIELEAPRLIPGLRAQLAALNDSAGGLTEGNVTAYRNLAGDVVNAIEIDLNRAGSPDVGALSALGDSVVRLIGGGAGEPANPDPERVRRSVQLLRQLISRYEQSMSAVRQ